ncbi:MAG: ABC transporter permease [Planctomycetia bacterium]|nr:ABC transporter permease [Planctomycetia bacterium]
MKTSKLPLLTTGVVLLFFYVPLALMVVQSFQHKVPGVDAKQWTTKWYVRIFNDDRVVDAAMNTISIGITAAVVSTLLGTLSAMAIYRYKSRLQSLHKGLLYIPIILPEILMGISLLICFSALGIELGRMTIVAAHVAFCTSYVAIIILTSLEGFDFTLVEASRDLGASWLQTFMRVLLPLLFPAICAGTLLAFTLSLDDFIVTFFVSGPGCTTLPVYIYSSIKHGRPESLCALSSVLLAATFVLVTISLLFAGNKMVESERA